MPTAFLCFIAGAQLQLRQTQRHQKTPQLAIPGDSLPPSVFKFVYV